MTDSAAARTETRTQWEIEVRRTPRGRWEHFGYPVRDRAAGVEAVARLRAVPDVGQKRYRLRCREVVTSYGPWVVDDEAGPEE